MIHFIQFGWNWYEWTNISTRYVILHMCHFKATESHASRMLRYGKLAMNTRTNTTEIMIQNAVIKEMTKYMKNVVEKVKWDSNPRNNDCPEWDWRSSLVHSHMKYAFVFHRGLYQIYELRFTSLTSLDLMTGVEKSYIEQSLVQYHSVKLEIQRFNYEGHINDANFWSWVYFLVTWPEIKKLIGGNRADGRLVSSTEVSNI